MNSRSTKSLSREEKINLLLAIEEKKRRVRETKPLFKERAHQGQLDVLSCDEDERFVFSGNGGGKTALGAEDLHRHATGDNPYLGHKTDVPIKAYVILDKPDKMETVIIPELMKFMTIRPDQLHKKGKPYISLITLDNGTTIRPLFWDQDPMTAEGIEGDYFWFDEPPPRPLYVALKRGGRTRGRRAKYLFTGTPLAAPWLRTEVYDPWVRGERKNTACFRFHTEMNRHNLAEGYIEKFSAVLSEREKAIRLGGEFFDLEGQALAHLFREDTHVVKNHGFEWDSSFPCVVAIDPHPSKKHVAVLVGADRDNRLMVLKELSAKLTARDFARELKRWYAGFRLIDIVCDSLGSADTTSGEGFKSFIQVLREEGVSARATSFAEKEDEAFISRIQDALQMPLEPDNFGQRIPKLRFLDTCRQSISDVRNVQWARDKKLDENKPKLDITNTDALACIKYALATNLYFQKPAKTQPHYLRKEIYGIPRAKITLRHKVAQKRKSAPADDDDDW